MKLAYIGTYPPRECGIGTFTYNLANSMRISTAKAVRENEILIVAMDNNIQKHKYPSEVKHTIQQENQTDYLAAADFINLSGADVCILQHEFGIFGGASGIYILPFLHRLEIPFIVTLHTILEKPSYSEKAVLKQICAMANAVVVMNEKAVRFLTTIYEVSQNKIELIEHGVPDIHFDKKQSRKEFRVQQKKLLLTFGFIGRNKGIEVVLKALPAVIAKHPQVLYMILGKTHPNVLRHSGEEYRNYLQLLIKDLKLEDHVLLLNEFIGEEELFKYLSACDIYLTPYLHEAQISSGTLSYAMGAGCAVVSTPYWHAADLLTRDRGRLFDFNDHEQLASTLNQLLDSPETLNKIQANAFEYGQKVTWPRIGKKYLKLCKKQIKLPEMRLKKKEPALDLLLLPPFSLMHIKRLTDDTGIIQHAKYGIPNLKEGYCLDDNARALLMVLMTYKQKKDRTALEFMPVYLSYIHYMQNKDGTFRNFLSFSRNFLDEVGSEDSFGRTIWALGYLIGYAPNDAYYQTGKIIFQEAVPNFHKIRSIRGIANTIIGICYFLKANPSDENIISLLQNLSYKLVTHYTENKSPNWQWFEGLLAYDNGILPLALLHSAQILQDDEIKKVGISTMDFLTEHTLKIGTLSIIGNQKWFMKDGERSYFAQQPIDAMAMVLMFYQAYNVTLNKNYLDKLFKSYKWFLGENDLRISLFDFETNGCCDGFDDFGLNRNQGAESSLAYLISHLTVLKAYEKYYETAAGIPKPMQIVQQKYFQA
ncbi:glycosyltransferase family 4 protein [Christiangramia aquimixticola]|uniref:glycosyltransferase family 4 protein n=1 Tax=Christiangramia aquimixticola TaxID=1697558 RepID=UPI003AA9DF37